MKLAGVSNDFVEIYRATPHTATNVSPFEAMHGGRKMKLTLPRIAETDHVVNKEREREYKKKMSESAKGVDHKLKVGDTVLMRQKKENKLTPSFKPETLTVTGVKGSSVEATNLRGAEVFLDASFLNLLRVIVKTVLGKLKASRMSRSTRVCQY